METSDFAAFLKEAKPAAVGFVRRRHVALWLALASLLLMGLAMRPSEVTVIILAANMLLVWLAVTLFKESRVSLWLLIAAEIMAATQMTPGRGAAFALIVNMMLMLGAVVAARLGAD